MKYRDGQGHEIEAHTLVDIIIYAGDRAQLIFDGFPPTDIALTQAATQAPSPGDFVIVTSDKVDVIDPDEFHKHYQLAQ